MEIEKKLYADIKEYCKLNDLKIGQFINNLLSKAFIEEKFGKRPQIFEKKSIFVKEKKNIPIEKVEKPVEKEVIETPVEETQTEENFQLKVKPKKRKLT